MRVTCRTEKKNRVAQAPPWTDKIRLWGWGPSVFLLVKLLGGASQVTQWVKNLPAMQEMPEMWVWSLGQEDPLEEAMVAHSSILAWKFPRTEEPNRLQFMEPQRIGHDWSDNRHAHTQLLATGKWKNATTRNATKTAPSTFYSGGWLRQKPGQFQSMWMANLEKPRSSVNFLCQVCFLRETHTASLAASAAPEQPGNCPNAAWESAMQTASRSLTAGQCGPSGKEWGCSGRFLHCISSFGYYFSCEPSCLPLPLPQAQSLVSICCRGAPGSGRGGWWCPGFRALRGELGARLTLYSLCPEKGMLAWRKSQQWILKKQSCSPSVCILSFFLLYLKCICHGDIYLIIYIHVWLLFTYFFDFPGGSDGKASICLQCRTPGFSPWVGNKETATHSSTLARKITWTEEPGRLQSMGSQRIGLHFGYH